MRKRRKSLYFIGGWRAWLLLLFFVFYQLIIDPSILDLMNFNRWSGTRDELNCFYKWKLGIIWDINKNSGGKSGTNESWGLYEILAKI